MLPWAASPSARDTLAEVGVGIFCDDEGMDTIGIDIVFVFTPEHKGDSTTGCRKIFNHVLGASYGQLRQSITMML